ncbi:unnamed protein product, partial [Rotaria magnacalcarata]
VTGDWGDLPVSSFDTQSEVAIVNAMGKLRIKLNTTSQFTLEDNFYYDGVKAVSDSRFQNAYERVIICGHDHNLQGKKDLILLLLIIQ